MKSRIIWAAVCFLLAAAPAAAFDNIEADVFYDRPLRQRIEAEFKEGLARLKKQADELFTQVREKDVDSLRIHMYEKALILGGCFDRAITLRKRGESVAVDKYMVACGSEHLEFKDKFTSGRYPNNYFLTSCQMHSSADARGSNKPYEFLLKEDARTAGYITNARDFVRFKRCFDEGTCAEVLTAQILGLIGNGLRSAWRSGSEHRNHIFSPNPTIDPTHEILGFLAVMPTVCS